MISSLAIISPLFIIVENVTYSIREENISWHSHNRGQWKIEKDRDMTHDIHTLRVA
jgi:hypothetical protein